MRNTPDTARARPAGTRADPAASTLRSALEAGITGGAPMMFLPSRDHGSNETRAGGSARSKLIVALVAVLMLAALWFGLNQSGTGSAPVAAETIRGVRIVAQKPQPPAAVPDRSAGPIIHAHPRGLPAKAGPDR